MIKLIAAAALALAPTSVLAQPRSAPLTARVPVGDLDLTTADGVRTLDQRLKGAVLFVCPGGPAPDLQQQRRHRICVAAARRSIADQRERMLAGAVAPIRLGAVAR